MSRLRRRSNQGAFEPGQVWWNGSTGAYATVYSVSPSRVRAILLRPGRRPTVPRAAIWGGAAPPRGYRLIYSPPGDGGVRC